MTVTENRDELIETLKNAINEKQKSNLTFEDVSNWVGSDDECYQIQTYIDGVETRSSNEVTADEILEYNKG